MRVVLIEHENIVEHIRLDERDYDSYVRNVETTARSDYPSKFLNIEEFNTKILSTTFETLLIAWIKENPVKTLVAAAILGISIWGAVHDLLSIGNEENNWYSLEEAVGRIEQSLKR